MLIVIGTIIRDSLKLIAEAKKLDKNVEEYRASKDYHKKYEPIVGDLDFKKRISLTYPFVFLSVRFALIGLLVFLGNGKGFSRTVIFHLLQFFVTIYMLSIKPFKERQRNKEELLSNLFLLFLTYFIGVIFVAPDVHKVRYAAGTWMAIFVISVIIVNVV